MTADSSKLGMENRIEDRGGGERAEGKGGKHSCLEVSSRSTSEFFAVFYERLGLDDVVY